MTELLDQLARSMAAPVPRKRALRMLGGAVVVASLPSWLRPASAEAHPAGTTLTRQCNPACGGTAPVKCVCPAKGGSCYIGGCGVPGSTCCCFEESNAGIPGAVVCPPGYSCGGGKGKPNCRCNRPCGDTCCKAGEYCGNAQQRLCCPTGQQACGGKCCERWEKCASPRRSVCCNRRETPCLTKSTVTCCSPGEKCCDGVCCTPNQICRRDGCECKPGTSRGKCGGDCCHPTRDKCCPGDGLTTKHCIRKNRVCCGASSCPPGGRCCSETQQTCARSGQRCCGATPYDPATRKCCGGDYLCGKDETCCIGSLCCGPKQECTPQGCQPAQRTSLLR